MLRVISCVYIEGQALRRNEFLKIFRMSAHSTAKPDQTVLSQDAKTLGDNILPRVPSGSSSTVAPPPPSPPPPPSWRSRRAFTLITALTFSASIGGVYLYRKVSKEKEALTQNELESISDKTVAPEELPVPASAEELPSRVQYLLVGGGTAAFAAMRAIRSARPEAQVLLVSPELALPYMRPPLSKELWREPELAEIARSPDALTFRQWNGRRRSLLYEPSAFYTPPDRLRDAAPGAGVARGWRVLALDPDAHTAQLESLTGERATLVYDKCLVASGLRPRRLEALREAAAAGRSFTVHDLRDVAALARRLEEPGVRVVAVVGGGLLAAELAAALAERLNGSDVRVLQLYRESAPLAALLPPYLAAHAERTLASLGVTPVPHCEVIGSALEEDRVRLTLAKGAPLRVDVVVECVGGEPDEELARRSRLETHPQLGGLTVNGELQARTDVWAAGDVACFYDEALGRRRVEHHDHAVLSGRLAGENMAAVRAPKVYTHQSMFWSDLGPRLGYEAIGIIDSDLRTVGVFSEDAVGEAGAAAEAAEAAAEAGGEAKSDEAPGGGEPGGGEPGARRYERGVVFYLRDERVVGVLLWNLFNRMHVARQVLARARFDDLFEVAKLFSLHDED